jgi:hypothetical protein
VGAGLFFAVAAILAVVVIPAAAKDTSQSATPGPAVTGFIVAAVLHVFLAALMLKIVRSGLLPVVSGASGLIFGGFFWLWRRPSWWGTAPRCVSLPPRFSYAQESTYAFAPRL